jgi:MFS family permease
MSPETQQEEETIAEDERLDFKQILPIFVIVLVDLLGLTIIIPLLPLYSTSFGASPAVIGALGATYPMFQFIGAPILGRLSDQYGRKPVLVVSQIGTFAGFILLGLANSLPLLFISRIIDGVSGANIATAQAAISDSTTEKTRTQGLGLIGVAFGLGFVIGPVIAFVALTLSDNNYRVPAFAAAVFSLSSILLTTFWFQESHPPEVREKEREKPVRFNLSAMWEALQHPAVGILLLLMFAQQIAFGGFEQLLALFTLARLGLNASGNAVIFVFVGVIVVTVQGGFIGPWSRRFGDRRLIYGGLALLAVGLVLFALTPRQPAPWYSRQELAAELNANDASRLQPGETPPVQDIAVELPSEASKSWVGLAWMLAVMVPLGIGGGILQPAINSLITKRVRSDEVGGMLGISSAFLSGANALAPLIGGALFQSLGASAPFLAGGLLMALLWGLALRRLQPGREEELEPGLARGGGH